MTIKRWLSAGILTALSTSAFAADAGTVVPTSAELDTYDGILAVFGAFSNPDSCGKTGVVIVKISDPNFDHFLAIVMTAGASHQSLNVWTAGTCTYTPWGGTAEVVQDMSITF